MRKHKILMIAAMALLIVLSGAPYARAASLHWTYQDSSMLSGWIFYCQATDNPNKTYTHALNDPSARSMDISALQLNPGTEYNIWVTAYNSHAESGKSNMVDFTTDPFAPPPDSHPVTITIQAPATVTITQP